MLNKLVVYSLLITALLVISVPGKSAAQSEAEEREILVAGFYPERPLLTFYDESGEPAGFEIALLNAIAETAEFDVEWVELSAPESGEQIDILSADDLELDIVIAGLTVPRIPPAGWWFSSPYFRDYDEDSQQYIFYSMAVSDETVLSLLDETLEFMLENGRYAELYQKVFEASVPPGFLVVPAVELNRRDPASVTAYYLDRAFAGDYAELETLVCDKMVLPEPDDLALFADFDISFENVYFEPVWNGNAGTVTLYGLFTIDNGSGPVQIDVSTLSPVPVPVIRENGEWLVCISGED